MITATFVVGFDWNGRGSFSYGAFAETVVSGCTVRNVSPKAEPISVQLPES